MKIIFTQQAFQKLKAYIQGIEYEISGFGKVEKREGNLVITDVRIFRQVVTSGNTIMDAQSLAQFWDELIVSGEDIGKWKLWWHSHVFMNAVFSGTDYETIDEFDSEMPEDNWMLSIVANKFGEMFCQVDIFEPIRCTISRIGWSIEFGELVETDVTQEIQDKVTIPSRASEERGTISWFGKKKSLPPIIKDGKVLSYQERLAIFESSNNTSFTGEHQEIIDLSYSLE